MGIVESILGVITAIAGAAALWFKSQRDQAKREQAEERAARAQASVEDRQEAEEAVRETRAEQDAEREPPDTKNRDDLEQGY